MNTTTTTPEYEIDLDDPRFTKIDENAEDAIRESDAMYDDRLEKGKEQIESQIAASKQWAETQSKLQQAQTDFAIAQIEQQKKEAEEDYQKEQSAAFVDYKKETNDYGTEAEQMAASGLKDSGYSETVKGGMYNAYQNRVAVARASLVKVKQNFDNAIMQAKLQNSAAIAEIAYNALQEEIALAVKGFEFENEILTDKANAKAAIKSQQKAEWETVYEQIMRENALNEEARQATLQYDLDIIKQEQDNYRWEQEYALMKEQEARELAEAQDASALKWAQHQLALDELAEKQRQFDIENTKDDKGNGGDPLKVDMSDEDAAKPETSTTPKLPITATGTAASAASQNETQTNTATVDQASVLALGYGPISEKELARLVASGEVSCVQFGDRLVFVRNKSKYLR